MSSSVKQYNLPAYIVIQAQAVSGNITSLVTDVFMKDNVTYQYTWTGTVNGSFSVQTSIDYKPNLNSGGTPLVAGNWVTLPIIGASAAGTPDSGTIELNNIGAQYVRTVFTYVSGSGNLTAVIVGKAI